MTAKTGNAMSYLEIEIGHKADYGNHPEYRFSVTHDSR